MSVIKHESSAAAICMASLPEIVDAEALSHDLRRLLVRSESALAGTDVRNHVECLERWVESYRRGLSAAQKISQSGIEMLHKTRDQLCLAMEELTRLEDEGGCAADSEQSKKVEEISAAIRRIDRLLPTVEHAFAGPEIQALHA